MITYQLETWYDFFRDARKLLQDNNQETDLFNLALDVDEGLYEELEDTGWLKVYTMRKGSELVGYCVFMLFYNMHHRTSLQAKQDVLYINKGNRGRCLPFLTYCDGELKELGVEFIHQCVPDMNDWSPVLKRMGYEKLETIYLRRL